MYNFNKYKIIFIKIKTNFFFLINFYKKYKEIENTNTFYL